MGTLTDRRPHGLITVGAPLPRALFCAFPPCPCVCRSTPEPSTSPRAAGAPGTGGDTGKQQHCATAPREGQPKHVGRAVDAVTANGLGKGGGGRRERKSLVPSPQCDSARNLEWLKTVKESHGSVELSSLSLATAINSRGIYEIRAPRDGPVSRPRPRHGWPWRSQATVSGGGGRPPPEERPPNTPRPTGLPRHGSPAAPPRETRGRGGDTPVLPGGAAGASEQADAGVRPEGPQQHRGRGVLRGAGSLGGGAPRGAAGERWRASGSGGASPWPAWGAEPVSAGPSVRASFSGPAALGGGRLREISHPLPL